MINLAIDKGVVSFDENKYPKIARLLGEGILFVENNDLVGKASDGTILSMCSGLMGIKKYDKKTLDNLEHYLASHPTPDTW